MKTYLSIDCDYFAFSNVIENRKKIVPSPVKQAEYLISVLELLNKPVYVTLGHDLHAVDVNRYGVERVINVDTHCDCYEEAEDKIIRFWNNREEKSFVDNICDYSNECELLAENNWIHFCRLEGKNPRIEHWKPHWNNYYAENYHNSKIWLVTGEARYKTKTVYPSCLYKKLELIKDDIVAVGIATSPDWCEFLTSGFGQVSGIWNRVFFGVLHTCGVLTDKTVYDLSLIDSHVKLPKKKKEMVSGIVFHPVKENKCCRKYYSLGMGSNNLWISGKDVIPHMPSIKNAAIAMSCW